MKIKNIKIAIPLFAYCLWANLSFGQSSLVSYTVNIKDSICVGDTLQIEVDFHIAPNWFIYSPDPINMNQGMQSIKVVFENLPDWLVQVGEPIFSPSYSKGGFLVYSDSDNVVINKFVLNSSAQEGVFKIFGKLIYQACNEQLCYPPVKEAFSNDIFIRKRNRRND